MEGATCIKASKDNFAAMKKIIADIAYHNSATLGEGAIWDESILRLWWVDIVEGVLHCFDPYTEKNISFRLGISVGAVVPTTSGRLLLAVKNGFAEYDPQVGELHMLTEITHSNLSIRFNDGKCDPAGRFWAGTLAEDGTKDAGILYCLDTDFSVQNKIENVGISNGIVWSISGDVLFYIDSTTQKIVSYAYDIKTGNIRDQRDVYVFPETEGVPDGMCIDGEGMLWVALWDGGKVVRIDPRKGKQIGEVVVPGVTRVTSCALNDAGVLYITTASVGLTDIEKHNQPNAGSLFKANVDVKNSLTHVFRGVL
jgi:sugar lactone lactonase YvrE